MARTREERLRLVEDYDATELEPHQWARVHGISLPTVRAWRQELLKERLDGAASAPAAAPAKPKAAPAAKPKAKGKRARRSDVDWPAIVAQQEASDMSIKRFCEARGVAVGSFHYHLKKARNARKEAEQEAKAARKAERKRSPSGAVLPPATPMVEEDGAGTDPAPSRSIPEIVAEATAAADVVKVFGAAGFPMGHVRPVADGADGASSVVIDLEPYRAAIVVDADTDLGLLRRVLEALA